MIRKSYEQLGAAPVAQASTVYLQLLVELQLLAAALLKQQQQQQQQQGPISGAPIANQRSPWLIMLRRSSISFTGYIRAATQAQEGHSGIRQLMAGPDAPLLRALAAPLYVAECWQDVGEQKMRKAPKEQLYALIGCCQACAESESEGSASEAGEECCCSWRTTVVRQCSPLAGLVICPAIAPALWPGSVLLHRNVCSTRTVYLWDDNCVVFTPGYKPV
jgi:hypothetical protein